MGEKKSYVKDYMTKNVISVSPETKTEEIKKELDVKAAQENELNVNIEKLLPQ